MQIPAQVASWAAQAQQQTGVSDLAAALALSTTGPESTFNPNATGRLGEQGLTQIYPVAPPIPIPPGTNLYDPVQNLAIAMTAIQQRLNMSGGDTSFALQPWSTRAADLAGLADAQSALASVASGGGTASSSTSGVTLSPMLLVAAVAALILLNS